MQISSITQSPAQLHTPTAITTTPVYNRDVSEFPGYSHPKLHVPDSIAQGDTIDNNDSLPDAGGDGIITRQSPPLWPSQGLQSAIGNLYKAL
jgi:hypothetical protein